ncbi:MAG TPA: pyridoxal-phosphate dependent enzyme [Steroidobacteraceae bacterium]|nr:pyridoxal-phosphate dependent enzyme [Steroidobacteraceae bacterium]
MLSSSFRPSLEEFSRAAAAIEHDAIQTPLLPFRATSATDIRLKAENLQPLGSFKIRAGANALAMLPEAEAAAGVATASAGNFAQGLALAAARRRIKLTVHAPSSAPAVKLAAIRQLGASIETHPYNEWWQIMSTRHTGRDDGRFIHPVCETGVLLGNGTIALELVKQWACIDTVFVPVGGGGLLCGIALAFRALGARPRIIACEVETAAPLAQSRQAGRPVDIQRQPSFVDGIGGGGVLPEMWPLLQDLVDAVVVVSLDEIRQAMRVLALENHLVCEGAGAASVAAALSGRGGDGNCVAIVSGGNIDLSVFTDIVNMPV